MKHREEFEKQLEQAGLIQGDKDAQAYQKVFDALSREPNHYQLHPGFADRVIARMSFERKESASRDNLFFVLGLSLMMIVAIIGAVLAGFKPDFGAFKFLAGYPGLVVFGIAFVLFLHWLDKKLVKKNLSV